MSNTTKSVEQLKAEAAALLKQAEEAEQAEAERAAADAAAEKERKEQEEMQRQAAEPVVGWPLKQYTMWRDIANATQALIAGQHKDGIPGLKIEVTAPRKQVVKVDDTPGAKIQSVGVVHSELKVTLFGERIYVYIRWEQNQQRLSSFRSRPGDKLLMKVGDYGDTKVYPPRKEGGYNYEGAALYIYGRIMSAVRAHQQVLTKRSNKEHVDALRAEFGLGEFTELVRHSYYASDSRGRGMEHVAPEGKLFFKFAGALTPEQCRAAIAALRAAGLEAK